MKGGNFYVPSRPLANTNHKRCHYSALCYSKERAKILEKIGQTFGSKVDAKKKEADRNT